MNSALGGYFGLELPSGKNFHEGGVLVNTARNAFEYIILACRFRKIYLPYFTCDALLEPVSRWGIEKEFYHIDETFKPLFKFERIKPGEGFLYTNYFGVNADIVSELSFLGDALIVDNAQAFFEKPIPGLNTFYSPRKFFGVSDGGIVYCNHTWNGVMLRDKSFMRFNHLLKRLDIGPEDGFDDFKETEKSLSNQPVQKMSNLTQALLAGIEYKWVAKKRIENFKYLHNRIEIGRASCRERVSLNV